MSKISEYYQAEFDRENGIIAILETLGDRDVTQIFVHSVTSLQNIADLIKIKPELAKFPERALVFARPDDIVCVLDEVDNEYLQFLSSLGLSHKKENIITVSNGVDTHLGASLSDLLSGNRDAVLAIRRLVRSNKKIVLNPYITSSKEIKLASILSNVLGTQVYLPGGDSDIVGYAEHKHTAREKALELGIPVPEGEIIELKLGEDGRPSHLTSIRKAIDTHIRKTGRVVIKGSYSSSGGSIFIAESNARSIGNALSKIAERDDNSIYLIEAMVDFIVSPNVLMHIEPDEGSISCVGVTDQILNDRLMHEGNIYPTRANTLKDMLSSAEKLSKWLQREGYSGLLGFDFIEYFERETGLYEHFLVEINPRINAAAYPRSLMEHLNTKQWQKDRPQIEAFLASTTKTKATSFTGLKELYGHLFFNAETGKGIVPFNTGCLEFGNFTLAVFGKSRNEVVEMYEDFKALIQM